MDVDDTTPPQILNKNAPKPRQTAQSKRWLFTIPNWEEDDLLEASEDFTYVIQGKELAPTTRLPHLQCYVQFAKDHRFQQILNKHPRWRKLQKCTGSPWSNYLYCSKEDKDPHEFGKRPKEPKGASNASLSFGEALSADTVEEGICIIKKDCPRDWCLHGEAIRRNLISSKVQPFTHKWAMADFTAPEIQLEKATLLVGDTKLGKTHFALAHFKNPLLVRHIDNLKKLTTDQDGIVFDDMSFDHWPSGSVIALLDMELKSSLNVRYGTVDIPAYTRKIFTNNKSDIWYKPELDQATKDAIDGRVNIVNIYNKIY